MDVFGDESERLRRIYRVYAFEDKHRLLQLNGGEQVKILERDGHILRVRVLPLPRGEAFDDFVDVHPKDISQKCYTFGDYDLFQTD